MVFTVRATYFMSNRQSYQVTSINTRGDQFRKGADIRYISSTLWRCTPPNIMTCRQWRS